MPPAARSIFTSSIFTLAFEQHPHLGRQTQTPTATDPSIKNITEQLLAEFRKVVRDIKEQALHQIFVSGSGLIATVQ
ncbi:hypothetical protein PENFLA_c020G04933 [Penicillium flavigenum]|uniref:Uncharacterized protein n=1 Tax=Penicillium flavigenum TaxID=254877 RepID=A0A1V6SXT7_9EURO|nr:hypothetical protein PENFLA_c020G04933 [Penicillium flavigenum]